MHRDFIPTLGCLIMAAVVSLAFSGTPRAESEAGSLAVAGLTQLAGIFDQPRYPPVGKTVSPEGTWEPDPEDVARANEKRWPSDDETRVNLGLAGIVAPEFEGGDEYEFSLFPLIRVENFYRFYLRGPALDFEALRLGSQERGGFKLRAGPSLGVAFGRDQDDSDALRGLGDVDTGVTAGGFVRLNYGPALLRLRASQEFAGGHGGALVSARLGTFLPIGNRAVISPGVSTTWASEDYMQSFFGVSRDQAARSVYTPFSADAGFKDVGFDVNLGVKLTEHWSATALFAYRRLIGDAADSPIVEGSGGSPNQFRGLLGLSYGFAF